VFAKGDGFDAVGKTPVGLNGSRRLALVFLDQIFKPTKMPPISASMTEILSSFPVTVANALGGSVEGVG